MSVRQYILTDTLMKLGTSCPNLVFFFKKKSLSLMTYVFSEYVLILHAVSFLKDVSLPGTNSSHAKTGGRLINSKGW